VADCVVKEGERLLDCLFRGLGRRPRRRPG